MSDKSGAKTIGIEIQSPTFMEMTGEAAFEADMTETIPLVENIMLTGRGNRASTGGARTAPAAITYPTPTQTTKAAGPAAKDILVPSAKMQAPKTAHGALTAQDLKSYRAEAQAPCPSSSKLPATLVAGDFNYSATCIHSPGLSQEGLGPTGIDGSSARVVKAGQIEISSPTFTETTNGSVSKVPEAMMLKRTSKKARKKRKTPGLGCMDGEPPETRKSLLCSIMEGNFNAAASNIQSTFAVPFALALGASNSEVGIMSSMQNLAGTAGHLPGAMLTKYMSRKKIWFITQVMARILVWIPILFLPFLELSHRILILTSLLVISNFFLSVRGPPWSSLMADIVSVKIRGRYFGLRNLLLGICGVFATLIAGFLVVPYGFHTIFLFSMAFATMSIFFFMRIKEPPIKRQFHYKYTFSFSPGKWYQSMKLNRNLMVFTSYLFFMNFAMDMAAPFYIVYMLKNLNIGYEWFAVAIVAGILVKALMNKYWGRLIDKFGSRRILIVCGLLTCFVPFGWMLASNLWQVILVKMYDGLVFSGFELVIFNYLLEVVPEKNSQNYIATHNFTIGFGSVAGNLIGGFLAQALGGVVFLWMAGLQVLFLGSFLLRLGCFSALMFTKDENTKELKTVPARYVFWDAVAFGPISAMKKIALFARRCPWMILSGTANGIVNGAGKIRYIIKFRVRPNLALLTRAG
jgi:MFS family permease